MGQLPFPLTATDLDDMKFQVWEILRQVYEEKIGGAELGDVFSIPGDVLTLVLASPSGLTKTGNELAIEPLSTGGVQINASGLSIKIVSTGGLETSASGTSIKCKVGGGAATDADGLYFSAGAIDHGSLADLLADDHTQYQKESEKDSASGYAGLNASSRIAKGADTTDDFIVDLATKGLVLKDTQAIPHYWRLSVSILGALTTTDLGVGKP